jgi:hypothetical protein
MKIFPIEVLVHEWTSWKRVGEIDIERAGYLLSTDKVIEEMLTK